MGFDEFDRGQLFPPDLLSHGNSRKEIQFVHAISSETEEKGSLSLACAGERARQATLRSAKQRTSGSRLRRDEPSGFEKARSALRASSWPSLFHKPLFQILSRSRSQLGKEHAGATAIVGPDHLAHTFHHVSGAGQNKTQRHLLNRRQWFRRLQSQTVLVQIQHHGRQRSDAELQIDQTIPEAGVATVSGPDA